MSIEDTNIQSDSSQQITSSSADSVNEATTEEKPVDVNDHLQDLKTELKTIQEQLAEFKKQDQVKLLKDELEKAKSELEKLKGAQEQSAGDKQAQLKAVSPTSFNTGTNKQSQAKNFDPTPDEILAIVSRLDSRK